MLVGYRTRLMTIIVWALILSIQWRNPLILNSGDVLLRLLLFWGMFLPLGAYWSVDRALKPEPARLSMRFISLATVALFLQIAFVYWFTAIIKNDPVWRTEGSAVYYALGSDQFATHIGNFLYQFPELLKVLTFATVGLEAFGPFLLFFPFFTGPVRTATVLAFMSLHVGIWLTMDVGLFSWTSALCMVCFLPAWFWDQAAKLNRLLSERSNLARRLQVAGRHLIDAYWTPVQARFSRVMATAQPSVAGPAGLSQHPEVTTRTWRGETRSTAGGANRQELQHATPADSGPTMLR